MVAWAREIKDTFKLRWNNVHKFQPKIRISIDFGSYQLKTADTVEELIESFKLRHEVFYREFQDFDQPGLDVDQFDPDFDHLLIIHRATDKIVGTYRVSCSDFSEVSYTALEFDLTEILKLDGPFLELGRACIHKDHRRGAVISLLWRGIAEYLNQSGASVLFGCSSLKINHAREAALVYRYLSNQGSLATDSFANPTRSFRMKDFDTWFAYFPVEISAEQIIEAESLIPSLLKSYLKLGAKVAGEPAFDKDFDCIDMLTVLKKEDLANSLAQRFQIAR